MCNSVFSYKYNSRDVTRLPIKTNKNPQCEAFSKKSNSENKAIHKKRQSKRVRQRETETETERQREGESANSNILILLIVFSL